MGREEVGAVGIPAAQNKEKSAGVMSALGSFLWFCAKKKRTAEHEVSCLNCWANGVL